MKRARGSPFALGLLVGALGGIGLLVVLALGTEPGNGYRRAYTYRGR